MRRKIRILIGLILIVLIGLGAYYIYDKYNTPKEENTSQKIEKQVSDDEKEAKEEVKEDTTQNEAEVIENQTPTPETNDTDEYAPNKETKDKPVQKDKSASDNADEKMTD